MLNNFTHEEVKLITARSKEKKISNSSGCLSIILLKQTKNN